MINDNGLIYDMSEDDINNKILEYLNIREDNKKKNGEVFTPKSLIEEMLNKLPNNIWSNPDLKWLDTANGIGNYPMIIYRRLMNGLINEIPDKQLRHNHIIQNMLYMIEINEININISKNIFGFNANIYCANFLNNSEIFFGINYFDIIIGNPPYNIPKIINRKCGSNTLWNKFVIKSLELLVHNGYLLFVHPAGWRKPNSIHSRTRGLFNLMAHNNQIEYLEIHNTKDGKKTFNVGTRYDWYLLKKHQNNNLTIVKDEKGIISNINLMEWNFLPNYNFNLIKNLLGNSNNVIYSSNQFRSDKRYVNENKTEIYKYPLIHSIPASRIRYYWSSTQTPNVKNFIHMFGVPKVIFDDTINMNDVIIDDTGMYGLTQHSIGLKINNFREGEILKHVLMSNEFKDIIKSLSFGNFRLDRNIFNYFRPDFYNYIY